MQSAQETALCPFQGPARASRCRRRLAWGRGVAGLPARAGLAARVDGRQAARWDRISGGDGPYPNPGQIPLTWANPRPSGGDFAMAAIGYGIIGRALTGFTGDVIGAGAEYGHQMTMLRAMGWSEADLARAGASAMNAPSDILGATPSGELAAIRDIYTISRNKRESVSLAPDLMRAATVLTEVGKGDQLTMLFKAMQAGELRGVFSPEQIPEFLRDVEATAVATGGRIGPAEILKYLQNAGAAGRALDVSNLFGSLIPTMLSMTAGRAGTALQGFYKQFGAEKMSQASGIMLRDMHLLIDPATGQDVSLEKMNLPLAKGGYRYAIGQYMFPPGMLVGGDLINKGHDAEFMQNVLLPRIKQWNIEHFGTDNIQLEAQTGMRVASTVTGAKELADFFSLLPLSAKYQQAIAAGATGDRYRTFAANDPTLKVAGLQAAWTGFLTSLANGPVMAAATKTLTDVTAGLNEMGAFANAHKDLSTVLVSIAGGLGVLAVAASGLSAALFLGAPMIRVAKWGAGALGGAAALGAVGGGGLAGAMLRVGAPLAARAALPAAVGAGLWDMVEHGNWLADTAWSSAAPTHLGPLARREVELRAVGCAVARRWRSCRLRPRPTDARPRRQRP